MTIFFTSDTHFNHRNILNFCPESRAEANSIKEMNDLIIQRWNEVVTDEDVVYHLGDVAFSNPQLAPTLLKQLKGKKILIKGNHDNPKFIRNISRFFDEVCEYKELRLDDGTNIVLFHYPIVHWNRKDHGAYHLYGHVHGKEIPELKNTRSMDVGIDTRKDFKPYTWEEIHAILSPIEFGFKHRS